MGPRERPVLLAPEGIVALNGTGEAIWNLCDGQRTLAEIVEMLGDEVCIFLTRLAARHSSQRYSLDGAHLPHAPGSQRMGGIGR